MEKHRHYLDIRGAVAPITFLQVNRAFRDLKPGEQLEIQGDDKDTRRDIFQVMNQFHYRIVTIEDRQSFFRICLLKESKGDQTDDWNNAKAF